VFVTLGIQRAVPMRHIFMCELPGSTIFLRIILQAARFKKKVIEHKTYVLNFSTNLAEKFSF